MTCKYKFSTVLFLFSMTLTFESKAMIDENKESHNKSFLGKGLSYFKIIPMDGIKEVFSFLQLSDLFNLRKTSKGLKNIVDTEYLKYRTINIRTRSSFPAIQDIKNTSFTMALLSFEKWEQDDIKQLLYFKYVTDLHLEGLERWDFSTGEFYNPSLCSYATSYLISVINFASLNMFGGKLYSIPIFENVTSLDLSNSTVGDYGVICFVSNFKKLKILNISNNEIGKNVTGEISAISNIKTLVSLNISKNQFSSTTVQEIIQLTNLTSLNISYNFISDSFIIKKLSQLPKLIDFSNMGQRSTGGYQYGF